MYTTHSTHQQLIPINQCYHGLCTSCTNSATRSASLCTCIYDGVQYQYFGQNCLHPLPLCLNYPSVSASPTWPPLSVFGSIYTFFCFLYPDVHILLVTILLLRNNFFFFVIFTCTWLCSILINKKKNDHAYGCIAILICILHNPI